eukprot:TRINITY_DN1179_c0_g1_i2.p1 TRINITY_DN1179_c0_g1~~TRINITY_DN1179_c0_g1_i2.p1  ORF type:complete len:362 (-),score=78.65 TRINITY_DN1179_c0_g1_i2:195-1205(-)
MDALYKEFEECLKDSSLEYKSGDRVSGLVFQVDNKQAFVEIGGKGTATCDVDSCSMAKVDSIVEVLPPGITREFVVGRVQSNGNILLSLKAIEQEVTWQRIRQLHSAAVTVNGHVLSANPGGVEVKVMNMTGFVPGSHLPMNVDKDDVVGQDLPLKIIDFDEEQQKLVFSARRVMSDSAMKEFDVGDVVEGTVTGIAVYGAFLDIGGGTNGLLHISQISHDRVISVEKVLAIGDKIKVMVLNQDKSQGRVSLSTKKIEPSPGDMLRDPQAVYDRAEEMAEQFRERVAAAEQLAREEEARLAQDQASVMQGVDQQTMMQGVDQSMVQGVDQLQFPQQ